MSRNIIKCGKYLERLDLYLCLDYPAKAVDKEFSKFVNRLHRSGLSYRPENERKLKEIIGLGEEWKSRKEEALENLWNLFEVV